MISLSPVLIVLFMLIFNVLYKNGDGIKTYIEGGDSRSFLRSIVQRWYTLIAEKFFISRCNCAHARRLCENKQKSHVTVRATKNPHLKTWLCVYIRMKLDAHTRPPYFLLDLANSISDLFIK